VGVLARRRAIVRAVGGSVSVVAVRDIVSGGGKGGRNDLFSWTFDYVSE
jgi:hypothetical protein